MRGKGSSYVKIPCVLHYGKPFSKATRKLSSLPPSCYIWFVSRWNENKLAETHFCVNSHFAAGLEPLSHTHLSFAPRWAVSFPRRFEWCRCWSGTLFQDPDAKFQCRSSDWWAESFPSVACQNHQQEQQWRGNLRPRRLDQSKSGRFFYLRPRRTAGLWERSLLLWTWKKNSFIEILHDSFTNGDGDKRGTTSILVEWSNRQCFHMVKFTHNACVLVSFYCLAYEKMQDFYLCWFKPYSNLERQLLCHWMTGNDLMQLVEIKYTHEDFTKY